MEQTMSSRAERLQGILAHPLNYLHSQRLSLPPLMDGPKAREVLNGILRRGLGLNECCLQTQTSAAGDLCIDNWTLLPQVASLIGAQAAWPHLARGAWVQQLTACERGFAPCSVAPRLLAFTACQDALGEQLQAIGLNALLAWRAQLPDALVKCLPLQFSLQVVERQQLMPTAIPDAALLTLAVQHARVHPNTH
jgi:type III secretion system OrgA/MxiK family protein